MADPATTATVLYVGSNVASSVMKTVTNAQNYDVQKQQHLYNAKVAESEAEAARAEYAMNASIYRSRARQQVAGAETAMGAMGNIGDSADAASLDAMFNLSKDLSALKYQYDNKAVKALNEAQMHKFNAKVARMNRGNAIIGGTFNTLSSVIGSGAQTYEWGLWGGKK